jgi:hypothetical protein
LREVEIFFLKRLHKVAPCYKVRTQKIISFPFKNLSELLIVRLVLSLLFIHRIFYLNLVVDIKRNLCLKITVYYRV